MVTEEFTKSYNGLNKEQKQAVDTIEGPVMVVAGPGTGKTQILTLRIANILAKTDTNPENILALTFTEAASSNMRKRLAHIVGSLAYRINIKTFHSFCNDIIGDYPESFPNIVGGSSITEVESSAIIEGLVRETDLGVLRPWGDPLYYIRDIIRKIEELKREGLSPEEFEAITKKEETEFENRDDLIHKKGAYKGKMKGEHIKYAKIIEKNKELAIIYVKYQEVLHKRRLYDWSDMIMEVLKILREGDGELKLILQEQYQYILVDEHQDTNNAQNKILELLCDFHQNPNIFIVGDEKQAIFRFQGASVGNFLQFKKLYPKASLIELGENYRSNQAVLDAAYSLINSGVNLRSQKNKMRENKNDDERKIYIAELKNKQYESQFIAEKIKNLIERGVNPEEIAVIYRANKDAFPLAEALEKNAISYGIDSDEDLFAEKFVRKFVAIIEAINDFGNDELLIPVLHIEEFGIDPLAVYKVIHKAKIERKPLFEIIKNEENIKEFYLKINKWAKEAKEWHLSQTLETIFRESLILESIIKNKNTESFLGIEKLFGEAKRIAQNRPGALLQDFVEFIKVLREHKLFIKKPKNIIKKGAVRLMTAHRSKGLEFEYVFIANTTESSFGVKSNRDSLPLLKSVYTLANNKNRDEEKEREDTKEDDKENDERRIFYVSITRAKEKVFITYPNLDDSDKEVLPSPFISEIREDKKEVIDTKEFIQKLDKSPEIIYKERIKSGVTNLDKEFISELFRSESLSATSLNNYLDCPWKYFYRNLLRVPSTPAKHQVYGSAMHGSVDEMWRVMKDRDIDENFLIESYKLHLNKMGILTDKEKEEAIEKGSEALRGWYAFARPQIGNPVISEFNIKGVILDENTTLSGKLDKVEFLSDKSVLVTDYKTGKPKSRNFIEGNDIQNQKGAGDIKRQLIFYKILLSMHSDIDMKEGIVEFLEPTEAGNYKRESFTITEEDVTNLKIVIKRMVDEILNLKFWDKTCEDKDCEYCSYRKLLK